jgi:hypothetical protein
MRNRRIPVSGRVVLLGAAFLFGGWNVANGLGFPPGLGSTCTLLPVALAVDPSPTASSDADGMLEPLETVAVEPSWQQKVTGRCYYDRSGKVICPGFICKSDLTETGTSMSLTGPKGGDYVVQDSQSPYDKFAIGGTQTGHYSVFVSAPTGRPAPHWDATLTESLAGTVGGFKRWTIHIGESFTDVPRSNPLYKKVEALLHSGITAGCAPGAFCPDGVLSRSDIAIFTARGLAKGGANIPASGKVGNLSYDCAAGGVSLFRDIAPTDGFCKHFHYLAARNVMPGCGDFSECPSRLLSRVEMAETVARALVSPDGDGGIPTTYGPDPITGRSYSCDTGVSHFTDVSPSSASCAHANFLWALDVIAGCGPDTFCPDGDITRGEMAKFLVNAFDLKLYGP